MKVTLQWSVQTLSVFTKVADDKYTVAVTPTAAAVTLNIAAGVVVNVSDVGNAVGG